MVWLKVTTLTYKRFTLGLQFTSNIMGSKRAKISKTEKNVEEMNSSEDSSEEISNEQIQATFEGRNLEEFDFHGIKQLLEQTFPKAHVDTSQMTDMLINQYGIGSVLKQVCEDDNETDEMEDDDLNVVYGVTSILNLSEHRDTPCIQQIFSFFKEVKKCGNETAQNKFNDILNRNEKIGLIVNERFSNLPATLATPMLSSLQKEIKQMKKKKSSYDFLHYIMICKIYRPKKDEGEATFCNEEECIFSSNADCSFEYNVDRGFDNKWSNDGEVIPLRRVLLFSADKFDNIVSQIINYVQT